jgi:hypothetical protein
MSARIATLFMLAGVALLAGCDPTEVVVVVDTDVQSSSSDEIDLAVTTQDLGGGFPTSTASPFQLPITLGVTTKGQESTFQVTVTLIRDAQTDRKTVDTRIAFDVPFTKDERRALFVPLFNKCVGTGTAQPNALDPDCLDLVSPRTTSFDEDNFPRIPKTASP